MINFHQNYQKKIITKKKKKKKKKTFKVLNLVIEKNK